MLTITPREQLMETSTSFPNFYSPFLSCQETHRPRGQLLAPLLHFTGWTELWLSQCFLKICALRCRLEKKVPQGKSLLLSEQEICDRNQVFFLTIFKTFSMLSKNLRSEVQSCKEVTSGFEVFSGYTPSQDRTAARSICSSTAG